MREAVKNTKLTENCSKETIREYVDKELIPQLTVKEKIGIMSGQITEEKLLYDLFEIVHYNFDPYPTLAVDRLGIPNVRFVDGPRGVVAGSATCFPVSMARGATFDRELEEEIGRCIGAEIRAVGGNYYGGVCINLPRNPRWGRAQETYGEDSYHIGEMGASLTKGIQSQNVMACIKHFALNSIENARFTADVQIDKRTLHEVYLPHFKKCIEAGAASVMCAYNSVLGSFCSENKYLLHDTLRDRWGFEGFTLSDFLWALHEDLIVGTHVHRIGKNGRLDERVNHGLPFLQIIRKQGIDVHIVFHALHGIDRPHGENHIPPVFVHRIEGYERIAVIIRDILVVAQAAEHGPGFHIMAVQHASVRPGVQGNARIQEDGPVDVFLSQGVVVHIIHFIPLHHRLIQQAAEVKPTHDVLVFLPQGFELAADLQPGILRIRHCVQPGNGRGRRRLGGLRLGRGGGGWNRRRRGGGRFRDFLLIRLPQFLGGLLGGNIIIGISNQFHQADHDQGGGGGNEQQPLPAKAPVTRVPVPSFPLSVLHVPYFLF